ncbi:hypothetical protein EOM39_04500 [Candidatus Gracilibacteria bacterium]|nr:hypothetical protein [Candidatus Gracilibacteria bacterium]
MELTTILIIIIVVLIIILIIMFKFSMHLSDEIDLLSYRLLEKQAQKDNLKQQLKELRKKYHNALSLNHYLRKSNGVKQRVRNK